MKKLMIMAGICMPSLVSAQAYTLTGTCDVKEGIAVLNSHVKKDTVQIRNGRFMFKGTIQAPVLALLEMRPASGIPADIILEPGEITVTVKDGKYQAGGTANNTSYQQLRNETAGYQAALAALREQSYQLSGPEKRRMQASMDSIQQLRTIHTGSFVMENKSFASLAALQATYRKETPSRIAAYLRLLKEFSADPAYRQIQEFYKSMNKVETGQLVPDFTLEDLNGKPVSLASFKGKYVLLDFWYHNCGFCRQMMPGMVKVYADLKQKGFEIVSISIDSKAYEKQWRDAIKEDGATWTELWDYDKTLPAQYGVQGYPHLFLLDREGNLLEQIVGFHDEAALRKIFSAYIH